MPDWPPTDNPDDWDTYIANAPTMADAQDRLGRAIAAGIAPARLLDAQTVRHAISGTDHA